MTDDGEQPVPEEALVRAATVVAGARQVALACHVNPDGDALGSMLGLFHVLRAAGVDVVASFPTPFVTANHYRELPGLDLLTSPQEFPTEPARACWRPPCSASARRCGASRPTGCGRTR